MHAYPSQFSRAFFLSPTAKYNLTDIQGVFNKVLQDSLPKKRATYGKWIGLLRI